MRQYQATWKMWILKGLSSTVIMGKLWHLKHDHQRHQWDHGHVNCGNLFFNLNSWLSMIRILSSHVALSWRLATVTPQMIQLQSWAARNSHHPFITPFITPKRRSDEVPYIKIHDETTTNIEPSSIPAHDSSWLLSQDFCWVLVIPVDFAW